MSPQEQLIDYIQKSRAIGKTDEVIKQELLTAGWQEIDVTTAFGIIPTSVPLPSSSPSVSADLTLYAGFWHRVAAAVVDSFLLWLIAIVVIVPVILMTTMGTLPTSDLIFGFVYLLQFAIFLLYYPYMESKKGATFGKMFIGVYVAKGDTGARLSFWRALGRAAAKMLSAIILGIGFLMIAFTKKKQGLHDIMTDAVVLKTPRANKYRTILTIILGTIGPALFIIFVMPIIMVAMVGMMLTGTVNPDFGDGEFTESDFAQEYQFEPSAVALTATQVDALLATTSIQKMLDSNPENFAEGYIIAGPTLVAWNPDYYGVVSVYLPDFVELSEDEIVTISFTEVLDVNGVDVLDRTVEDVPPDFWIKGYMSGESYTFAYDARKPFAIREGVADEDIKTISGNVQFKAPLESGETYERSYDFTLQYQAPVE